MYAIIEDSGRQFKVTGGDTLRIDRSFADGEEIPETLTFDRVLLVGGGDAGPTVGSPAVAGATVTADVIGRVKAKKITIQKYKRRKGYSRKMGHRQQYLAVKVTGINVA